MLRIAAFVAVTWFALGSAGASTWGVLENEAQETPITADEWPLFQRAERCAVSPQLDGVYFQYRREASGSTEGIIAVFAVYPDRVVRLWNASAERISIDLCMPSE